MKYGRNRRSFHFFDAVRASDVQLTLHCVWGRRGGGLSAKWGGAGALGEKWTAGQRDRAGRAAQASGPARFRGPGGLRPCGLPRREVCTLTRGILHLSITGGRRVRLSPGVARGLIPPPRRWGHDDTEALERSLGRETAICGRWFWVNVRLFFFF